MELTVFLIAPQVNIITLLQMSVSVLLHCIGTEKVAYLVSQEKYLSKKREDVNAQDH